ncbi:MAG: 30S ribosomal protein S2, partial [Lapillicoccus sp.]
KKQAQEAIAEQSTRVGMPYVNQRWLGGMLTNFQTVHGRLQRLKELEQLDFDDVAGSGMTKKELLVLKREKDKLDKTLGGIRDMSRIPSAVWIVDTKKEHIAVGEAHKLGIPVVAILDTNCDPDDVDYKIPGNDDAIRSVTLLTRVIADAVAEGIVARAGGGRAAGDEQVAAEEPLAEWERELYAEAAAAEATEVAPVETPSAEVMADVPTEADVAEQAQPLPMTGTEPAGDDTARHSGAEILVAQAEKAERVEEAEQAEEAGLAEEPKQAERAEEAAQA